MYYQEKFILARFFGFSGQEKKGDMKIISILAESYHKMGKSLRTYKMQVRSTISGVYLRQLLSSLDPASQKYDTDKMRSREVVQNRIFHET